MDKFARSVLEAETGKTHLFSVGQAGFIIKNKKGKLLAIDLYLSNCVQREEGNIGFKRLLPNILEPDELIFDYIIATHPHFDHYDIDAMPILMSNDNTKLFASLNCEQYTEKCNIDAKKLMYVKPGDIFEDKEFKIEFVNCDHGVGAPDAVGVIVNVDDKRIYEAGDTCLRLDWVEEYKRNGNIDVMIAPINGAYGNLNEEDCVRFCNAINPKLIIPCHYGMFASHGGDVSKFITIMKEQCPYNKFVILTQGEDLILQNKCIM